MNEDILLSLIVAFFTFFFVVVKPEFVCQKEDSLEPFTGTECFVLAFSFSVVVFVWCWVFVSVVGWF